MGLGIALVPFMDGWVDGFRLRIYVFHISFTQEYFALRLFYLKDLNNDFQVFVLFLFNGTQS